MPEAVIVATARSPIGRAVKGSLKDLRPDDLAATIVQAALAKVPQLDPRQIDDLFLGCGLPGGEQGFNMARVVAVLLGPRPPAGRDRHPLLLLVAADHPDGVPRHQGRRGRRVHLRRRRVRVPVRARAAPTACRRARRHPSAASGENPRFATPRAHRGARRAAATLARPARGRRAARRLHRDGPDRREPRRSSRASAAQEMDEFGVRSRRTSPRRRIAERLLGARDHPGDPARRHGRGHRRRPARRRDPGGGARPQAGLPPRRPGHRRQLLPAQRRRRRRGRS